DLSKRRRSVSAFITRPDRFRWIVGCAAEVPRKVSLRMDMLVLPTTLSLPCAGMSHSPTGPQILTRVDAPAAPRRGPLLHRTAPRGTRFAVPDVHLSGPTRFSGCLRARPLRGCARPFPASGAPLLRGRSGV